MRYLYKVCQELLQIFNRPVVAGAPGLFYKHLCDSLSSQYSRHHKSLPVRARGAEILRECSPPTMCHMSHIPGHMLCLRCQVSQVVYFFFFSFAKAVLVELVVGGSLINGAYSVYLLFYYKATIEFTCTCLL